MATHGIILSLASNHDATPHLFKARQSLEEVLSDATYTRELLTQPCGHARLDLPYTNQLVAARTRLSLPQLQVRLKAIEARLGRNDDARRQGLVPVDLDVLCFDGQRLHLADWDRPYVQELLKELPLDCLPQPAEQEKTRKSEEKRPS